ncbi:IspD/TarI family cytidylyltransferase [Saccharomonospora azurea]|uniref:4-diphosphocytidyl-2-methyl-D-erythritol synthase n=1 Tax=Saccharomonospora azurea NA-128 TaxID=882081 RepID=H8GC06_9PSEU|nr:IspD/TarI family cytidylyltransferase [Saccharomonospora azurea]EHK87347.1 2-C-methyl-D-erythritol 4-phosphate cytidylyltransferase [Saccharomonospora azurea SZMC 14600]EHY90775.1 4-diphosphocytidyl-2-methyl-D-erythritol synthase [Saccharomonospora azurea NA-128]
MVGGRRSPGAAGVVLASGAGTRVGAATNKVYLPLAGRSIVSWSLEAFARAEGVDVLVLVTRPVDADLVERVCRDELPGTAVEVVHGGRTRQESELFALRHLRTRIESDAIDTVLLHDGARPLVSTGLIETVLRVAREYGGALPGLEAHDIVALDETGEAVTAPESGTLVRAQTPQGFRAAPLLGAYEKAEAEGFVGTDTASCMERFSDLPVRWLEGEESNIKVTYPHDLVIAAQVLAEGA